MGVWTLDALRYEELPQVAAIEAMVFPEPLSLPELQTLWTQPGTRYVCFRDGHTVAAYFGFQVHGPTAHVISNATHPNYRRRGLGSRVLAEAEPIAKALGARWYLGEVRVSNDAQLRLLKRIGWLAIGTCPRFFGNGEDAIIVWRCFDHPVTTEG